MPDEQRERFSKDVAGFIGQEATHRRIHALFNKHLTDQGFDNEIERRAKRRMDANAHRDPRVHVAATAATEHFTAIFADWMLRHPEALEGSEDRIKTLWLWHASEESEHRNTAFDVYQAMGGSTVWRIRIFRFVTFNFLTDIMRQTVRNLWHDGSLFKWSTWRSCGALLFSKDGMFRGNFQLWKDYLRADFHPSQHDASSAQQWLQANAAQYAVVGQAA